jgi:hypothetical protein
MGGAGQEMRPFESKTHSFIVKIWLEEMASDVGRAMWRGHITHVPDGERRYLQSTDEISAFIDLYLGGMDEKHHLLGRLSRWLNRRRQEMGKVER